MAKQAKVAVRKFNEDSTVAAAEASVRPKKSMAKKPAHKPSASSSMPSRLISSAKHARPIPHAAAAPPKSLAAPTKSSALVHLATCQRTTGISIASGASASPPVAPNPSTGPSLLKTKTTAGRGSRPSPHKKQVAFQVSSEEDEADDEELAEIIRDRQVRTARAKGTNVPLLLDPKLILDYIDL